MDAKIRYDWDLGHEWAKSLQSMRTDEILYIISTTNDSLSPERNLLYDGHCRRGSDIAEVIQSLLKTEGACTEINNA